MLLEGGCGQVSDNVGNIAKWVENIDGINDAAVKSARDKVCD